MEQTKLTQHDTIVAVSTPNGSGGIAVIRVSGKDAIEIVNSAWKGKNLLAVDSHTAHLGRIVNIDNEIIDEVVATVFRSPNSFTGENTIEISCHGSKWIQRELVNELIRRGCRSALGGEFSQRAFINGKIDLAEAEGIADLIASSSRAAHRIAISQMKGDFSKKLLELRQQLLNFVSLIELELDFSEEDVEFADRTHLTDLAQEIKSMLDSLTRSFSIGSVIKSGIPIALVGATNVGKSTLLNRLLNEDKAIVSDVHGTTRDVIEDTIEIEGILFRIIDTAGLRETADIVENLGIERTRNKISNASLILWIIDPTNNPEEQIRQMNQYRGKLSSDQRLITVINKSDTLTNSHDLLDEAVTISAKTGDGIEKLITAITSGYTSKVSEHDIIITNARHYDALLHASESIERAIQGLQSGISGDFVSQDIRETMHYLGEITGTISTDDLLGNIFANFCIGK